MFGLGSGWMDGCNYYLISISLLLDGSNSDEAITLVPQNFLFMGGVCGIKRWLHSFAKQSTLVS